MKLKTLLLSSAAAFAFVGAAQAADLSVAEPVDYVKVCDAFGAGYWYIPGTDTCLKIGGHVREDIVFHSVKDVWYGSSSHSAGWQFITEGQVTVTAKSMTEYGPLTGFVELLAKSDNAKSTNSLGERLAYSGDMYLSLGMLLVGRTGSVYDYSGGFTWDWKDLDSDAATDQVRLTWAMSGFGIQLAIEDPRDRWGTSLSTSYEMPNIVGNITWAQGHWSAQLSGGFAETTGGSGFGAQIASTIKLDQIAPGDQLLLKAAWAQNEVASFANSSASVASSGSIWSAAASFQHFWAPTLSSAVTFQYSSQSAATTGVTVASQDAYSIAGNLVWSPVTGFFAGVEGGYAKSSLSSTGTWGVKIRLQRDW